MKDKIIGLVAIVALLLGVFSVMKDDKVVVNTPNNVGAVSTFNATPEINLGGLRLVGLKKSLATATSTVCAIQSPTATSTLISAGVEFTLASTSATVVDLAKGLTQYATTTRIGSAGYAVGASARATIVASSTGSVAGDVTIFAPNTWFVVKYTDNNNGAGNASTGQCYAVWGVTS